MVTKTYDAYDYTNSVFQDRRRLVRLNEEEQPVQHHRRRLCGSNSAKKSANLLAAVKTGELKDVKDLLKPGHDIHYTGLEAARDVASCTPGKKILISEALLIEYAKDGNSAQIIRMLRSDRRLGNQIITVGCLKLAYDEAQSTRYTATKKLLTGVLNENTVRGIVRDYNLSIIWSGCTYVRRRLIAQTPEPLVKGAMLTSTVETPAIAESSPLEHVPTLLFVFLALFIGYLFYRCVKARRAQPRPLAYPVGLLGDEAEPENHDDA